ncbi:hypothetical protein CHS0354_016926 [Potamilus streckersoni]|uniref:TIR domain-containing protein n=1 Tax=Potamilus streckersoni TaxID=2493646 RepID=A0AAE0VZ03_9BIVA|nr:hypothetical protein CHS0354_016926 [Potamilus streckersoni]
MWLLVLATATKTTLITSAYSLCVSSVPCKCRRDFGNRLIVDCSKLNLTEIPRIPNDTVFLSLSNNEISVVENRTFSNLPYLLSLDLSSNSMRIIDLDGFQGLEKLRRLELNRNNIPLTVQGFEPGVFRSLKNLCYLSIQNVQSKRDNSSYPGQVFAGLNSLTTLKIDGIPNAIFEPEFSKLHNLRMLKLSSDKCNIDTLSNSTLVHLPFLTHLDVSFCHINRIEPGALIPLKHLQYLDISDNVALSFEGLRNASFGLINGSITILKANKLYPTFHLSVQLNSAHLEFLNQTNIKDLYLDENQIELVESNWGNVCPRSMENLSVVGNKFTFGLYIFQADKCKSLKIFNGGYQHPTHMPFSSTSEAQYVRKHIKEFSFITTFESHKYDENGTKFIHSNEEHIWDFLSYCNMSCNYRSTRHENSVPRDKHSTSLPQLNGNGESIKDTNASDINTGFSKTVFPIIVPPSMEEFHFQFADLRYEIPEINFRNSSLTFINVSGNSFYKLVGPLMGLDKLKTLDVSDNLCSYLSDRFLENIFNIRMDQMNISHLIVSRNLLSSLPANVRNQLTNQANIKNITVDLTDNPLQCDCTAIMYRYRWKLRYLYYMTKRRYRGYSGLYDDDRENYQFDAFLSCADNNLRFVKFTLLPKVEIEGLHLCIHHRDFLPGEEIAANIANAIHRSRKTIVLLDDDFLSSYWCMYELNMARMESVYSRKGENILILLLKDGIDKSKLPLELLDLIDKNTYIELPQDLVHVDMSDICIRLRETITD